MIFYLLRTIKNYIVPIIIILLWFILMMEKAFTYTFSKEIKDEDGNLVAIVKVLEKNLLGEDKKQFISIDLYFTKHHDEDVSYYKITNISALDVKRVKKETDVKFKNLDLKNSKRTVSSKKTR